MRALLPPLLVGLLLSGCRSKDDAAVDTGEVVGDPVVDADGDGYDETEDCDDASSVVSPGAEEICDGIDNNCDGTVDEGVTSDYYADTDGDGFGDADSTIAGCEIPDGYAVIGNDCDDDDADSHPGAPERCDEADNDCDGEIDEDVRYEWYADADRDSFGDPDSGFETCDPPPGYVSDSTDCDDTDDESYPGGEEVCDEADNDCDGTIDEDVTATFYEDTDGDTYGVSDATTEACTRPTGYAAEPGDCDDTDRAIHPDAVEVCDEIDNDCDGDTDEDAVDTETFYADADSDGFGDADSTADACSAPSGYTADDSDCDDTDSAISPDGVEVCDEVDNDCDGDVDTDATDMATFYADSDGDGYGSSATTAACSLPSGFSDNADDCDDGEVLANPGEAEVCDEIDNDCDGDIDEGVTTTFYLDADEDGYGDPDRETSACAQPSDYVADDSDCDDLDDESYPGASEVCDEADNDCDGSIDEDAVDTETFYADSDGDGFGDADSTADACSAPSGYVDDDSDCDDLDDASSPDGVEVCDEVDNDCDGDIDEDAVDAEAFYADADGDGYGDPGDVLAECEQPSGYVDNSDDCDDTDASDTDSDGLQDCEDDDIDGDGLRNDWDADAYDGAVARGPTAGLGGDGDLSLTSSETQGGATLLDGGATAGDVSVDVLDSSDLSVGDEVLVLSQQGDDAGAHQLVFVAGVSGDTLTIEPPLSEDFASDSVVLVQRVSHYVDVDVNSTVTWSAPDWAGAGGGVLIFRAEGDVTIAGTLDASGAGYRGGDGVYGNSSSGDQGESHGGLGAAGVASANDGGGGAYPARGDNGDSGGGGGYGTAGSSGTSYSGSAVTSGGSSYGDVDLSAWFAGSGGGGGSPDTESDGSPSSNYSGNGGAGGGLIAVFAGGSVTVTGAVTADGRDGDDASSYEGEVGGGGGGAGGLVYLAAPTLTLSGSVTAEGGSGGSSAWHSGSPYGSAYGGAGGDGRIRLDYDSLTGSTSPSAGSTSSYID